MELLMVITVLSTLTGLALPTLSQLQVSRTNLTATRIRRAFVYAQDWALGSGEGAYVAVDQASGVFRSFRGTSSLPLPDPLTQSPSVLVLEAVVGGMESLEPAGLTEVHFDAQGRPRQPDGTRFSDDVVIELKGSIFIRITRNTGLIYIE